MAVVIAKNNAGEYNFVDNITDQEKNIINEANQTTSQSQGNAQEKPNTSNDNDQSDSSENVEITGLLENSNGSVKINTPADLQIKKETAVKIQMLLNSWMSDICTEKEYNLIGLIEDKLQKVVEKESIDTAEETDSSDELTDDGAMIYTNMRQLVEYYNNISDYEDSPSSSLRVPRCTYWDGHTQDVMLHSQGEPSEDPNIK